MTIKENDHGLDEEKTESLIHLGQGCLDCLLELGTGSALDFLL
jgi:hypothetical protein